MKKMICLLLVALLCLTGCQPGNPGQTTSAPTETTVALPVTETTAVTDAPEETTAPAGPLEPVIGVTEPGESLPFANAGKLRLAYTGPRSYVKYITSLADLPGEEALQGYDEAFFENHALLIVVETLNSGSVQVEFDSVKVTGDTATVSLKRTMSGDVGTSDMATWLLWAEVEKNLDYTWILEGGSQTPAGEKY